MSTSVDDDPQVVPPDEGGEWSDAEILARCRELEARRRADLAEHIRLFRELEARKLYYADGHRDLAGFGRAEYRWADRDAKAHRDLERFARTCPQVLEQLTIGRVGTAQAFLLARLSRAPRVGMFVAEQIDDFLDHAAKLSFLDFEQYVTAWKYLMDQDGPDPDRAHRNRKASLTRSGLTGVLNVEGPAIDHARLKTLMAHFEEIEFQRDWANAKARFGPDVAVDQLARTATQRRYDAFQELLRHVTLPKMVDPELNDSDGDTVDSAPEPDGPVQTILNIVIDAESAVHGLEQLLGIDLTAPVRSPFGPDRAFCSTFDGDPIALRDAVLAGIAGKVRIVLRDSNGLPTAMSSASRLFTGAIRDAVLMTATHCTHDGCIVPTSNCQTDHLHPSHHGGATSVENGGLACGHHNRWRYAARVRVTRLADGTIATYRPDGTRIAPPPN
jgi:hypothetical protein